MRLARKRPAKSCTHMEWTGNVKSVWRWGITAIGKMFFLAGEWRIEDANEAQVAVDGTQNVLIMLIERIERAGSYGIGLAGLHVDHFTAPGNTVIRLQVMLVVKPLLGALPDDCVMKRKPHAIGFQEDSTALPAVAPDMAGPVDDLVELSHDHC